MVADCRPLTIQLGPGEIRPRVQGFSGNHGRRCEPLCRRPWRKAGLWKKSHAFVSPSTRPRGPCPETVPRRVQSGHVGARRERLATVMAKDSRSRSGAVAALELFAAAAPAGIVAPDLLRSEEHTSELQP